MNTRITEAQLREAIEDAADEYSKYIVEDTAHITIREHMLNAFDAALATLPQQEAAPAEAEPSTPPAGEREELSHEHFRDLARRVDDLTARTPCTCHTAPRVGELEDHDLMCPYRVLNEACGVINQKVPFQFDYLAEFYKVDTASELIAAQAQHIKQMENTLRERGILLPSPFTSVREG